MAKNQAAASVKPAKSKPTDYMRFWLTRDTSAAGLLSDRVDVWLMRPRPRTRDDGSRYYEVPAGDPHTFTTTLGVFGPRYARWTVEQCLKNVGTYPEDDRQVIAIGAP